VREQDWLHNEWEKLDATLQSATLPREWLLQMGRAAADHGIKIQYAARQIARGVACCRVLTAL
jgi:hypothetical protein